jgi:hypothetical protein
MSEKCFLRSLESMNQICTHDNLFFCQETFINSLSETLLQIRVYHKPMLLAPCNINSLRIGVAAGGRKGGREGWRVGGREGRREGGREGGREDKLGSMHRIILKTGNNWIMTSGIVVSIRQRWIIYFVSFTRLGSGCSWISQNVLFHSPTSYKPN